MELQAGDWPATWLPNHPVRHREVFSDRGKCLRESLYHGMTLGWEALHHFLCTNKTRCVGGCPPSTQLVAKRAPLAPPLPSDSPLPNLILGGPKWPYVPFGGTASLGGGGHNQRLLQAPATVIKPSHWIFMACLTEKETGVTAMWPLRLLLKRPVLIFFFLLPSVYCLSRKGFEKCE